MPRLLAISDRRLLAARRPGIDLPAWAAELDRLGVDARHLRERDLDDRTLYQLALDVRRRFGGILLISARADLALASAADGVQLPADGLPVELLRRRFPGLVIGCSTHAVDEIERAEAGGADFVLFGPVFDTPSKRGVLAARGLDGLARAAASTCLPVLALGGVAAAAAAAAAAHGAFGLAAIRHCLLPADAAALVHAVRSHFDRCDTIAAP